MASAVRNPCQSCWPCQRSGRLPGEVAVVATRVAGTVNPLLRQQPGKAPREH